MMITYHTEGFTRMKKETKEALIKAGKYIALTFSAGMSVYNLFKTLREIEVLEKR